jgi:hypothetical protein
MFTVTSKTKNHNKITHHSTVNETNSETKEYVEQQKKKKKFTTNRSTSTGSIDIDSQIK